MCDIKKELKKYDKLKKRIKVLENIIKFEDDRERKKELENEIKSIRFQLNILDNLIERLPSLENKIIKCKYIYKYNQIKTCDLIGYCERSELEKRKKAIRRLDYMVNKYGYIGA